MSKQTQHLLDEADIGSGEKSPGEKETDAQIAQIPVQNTEQQGQGGGTAGKPQQARDNKPAVKKVHTPEQLSDTLVDTSSTFPPKGN